MYTIDPWSYVQASWQAEFFVLCSVHLCVTAHTQHTGAHEVSCHKCVASQHAHVVLQLGVQLSLVLRVASNITHSFIFVYLILSSSL